MNRYTATTTQLPESIIEIQGTVPWAVFAEAESVAFKTLAAKLDIDGFRKGSVPETIARTHISDDILLAEMAERTMHSIYPELIRDTKLDLIGRPELSITKLARDNDLGFTLRAAVLPEIKLPVYKAIAGTTAPVEAAKVTEEDVDKVIEDLRQLRAHGHVHGPADDLSTPDHAGHKHDEPLPEVTDEFAQSFGSFKTVADMREKILENSTREKGQEAQDKRRITIMESIISQTDFAIPALVLESEQQKMLSQIEADVARAGFTLDAYLAQSKKTKDTIMAEFKPEAEKRARFQLVLNAIARDANISASEEMVNAEADRMMQAYPGADRERAVAYADMVLTNEATLSMLEKQ